MKTIHKLKQSTSNFKNHFVRDSKVVVAGTLFMFMLFSVASVSAVEYSIIYDDNVVSNMPTDAAGKEMGGSTIHISSKTPTRDGYSFLKWCTKVPESDGTCSGTEYLPSSSLTIDGTSKNEYELYAMWEEVVKDISTATYLQEVEACPNSLVAEQAYILKDNRDDTEYHVSKLADGKCWMLDNLALDPSTATLDALKGNTNASDTTLGYYKNGGGSSPYASAAVANKSAGFSSFYSPYVNASVKDTESYGTMSGSQGGNKLGVFYNYCAASAGSYCYASGSGTGDATEDICPSGWRMPTSGNSGEYQNLYAAYSNSVTGLKTALSVSLSGYFYGSMFGGQGSYGNFWSSTYYDGVNMNSLYVNSSSVKPANYFNRSYGYSVRCVLK